MRFRGKSIRRKIVALLLVPLVSLSAIWAFATVLTGREAADLFNVSSVVEKIGYPIEDTVRVLQEERRQTLVYLADPRASDGLAALRRSRSASDKAVGSIRENARNPDVRDAMGEDTDERLTAVLDAFEGIESLRSSVEDGTVNRSQALDLYNRLVDPCYVLLANLHVVDNVELDKQYRALVNLARARELLSREDALLGSALIVGEISHSEERDISDLVAQRTLMYDANLPLLPVAERDRYESFWKNASSAPLRVAEEAAVSSGSGAPRGVSAKSWDSAAGNVLDELGTLNDQANDRYQDRVDPVAMGVIAKAVIAERARPARAPGLPLSVRARRPHPHPRSAATAPGSPRGVRGATAQRDAPSLRGRAGRRRDRGPAPGVRQERDGRGRPGPQLPAARRRRSRRQTGRAARRLSPRSSSTSRAAARSCSTGSSRCSTPWSAGPRTPRNSPTCSASTT